MLAREDAFQIAVAVAPVPPWLKQPGEQPDGRIMEAISKRLGLDRLHGDMRDPLPEMIQKRPPDALSQRGREKAAGEIPILLAIKEVERRRADQIDPDQAGGIF